MKLGFVVLEQLFHAFSRLGHETLDLLVDTMGGGLAVVGLVGDVPAEEDLVLLLAQRRGPELIAHAPVAYHVAADAGDLFDIALRAGGHFAENDLLGRPAAQGRGHRTQAVRAGLEIAFLRQGNGHAKAPALRKDRHLVQGIDFGDEFEGEGVTGLVIGHDLPLLVADHEMALRSHHDLFFSFFEVFAGHGSAIVTRSDERRLVHHVGQVRADHAGHALGEHVELDRIVQGDLAAFHVDLEDFLAADDVGPVDDDVPVEAAGAEQRGIEHVRTVRRTDHDDGVGFLEAVQPHQQLVQGLFPLVVPAAESGAPVSPDGVDLIDEDDTRSVLAGLVEEVPHTGGAHADEHLHEVRSAHAEEGHARLTGDGLGQQRFSRARRTQQQGALRYPAAQGVELVRVLQELHDLLQVALGLEHAGHVGEGDGGPVFHDHLGPALAEGEHAALARLHLAQDEDPEPDEQQPGQGGDEVAHPVGGLRFGRNHDVPGHEIGHQLRVVEGDVYLEFAQALVRAFDYGRRVLAQCARNQLLGDGDLLDVVGFEKLLELRVRHRYRVIPPPGQELGGHQEEQKQHEPDQDRSVLPRLVGRWLPVVSGVGLSFVRGRVLIPVLRWLGHVLLKTSVRSGVGRSIQKPVQIGAATIRWRRSRPPSAGNCDQSLNMLRSLLRASDSRRFTVPTGTFIRVLTSSQV